MVLLLAFAFIIFGLFASPGSLLYLGLKSVPLNRPLNYDIDDALVSKMTIEDLGKFFKNNTSEATDLF